MRLLLLLTVSLFLAQGVEAQQLRVGFYNVENLFDTINNPGVDDGEFTPQGKRKWGREKYFAKLKQLSGAIALFSPDVLGLCEVENRGVVEDLAQRTHSLRGVVHYDSRDSRGIDPALIYDTSKLRVVSSEPIFISPMRRHFLRVEFTTASSLPLIVFVVHLPSKLGGKGAAKRRSEALHAIDSLVGLEGRDGRVVVMGDFNDSPRASGALHNCALEPYARGQGSYAYRDVWDMIDQILISPRLLPFTLGEQTVVCDPKLLQRKGKFSGYPKKSIISDHLPVYVNIDLSR